MLMPPASMTRACRNWWKSWFASPETFLLGAIGLMTLWGMTLFHSGPTRVVFWLCLVPVTLWLLVWRGGYKQVWRSTPMRIACCILLLYFLSAFWSMFTTGHEQHKTMFAALQTAVFITGLFLAVDAPVPARRRFAKVMMLAGIAGAVVSIVSFYSGHPISARLDSEVFLIGGITSGPPVLLGVVMAAGVFMEVDRVSSRRYWLVAGYLMVGILTLLAQARTTLVSYVVVVFLVGAYYLGVRRIVAVMVVLAGGATAAILLTQSLDHAWSHHLSTGLNGRAHIWLSVLEGFVDKPWIGHGAASIFRQSPVGQAAAVAVGHSVQHPHGLFFSMLYYFGLVGAVLWLAYIAALVRSIGVSGARTRWVALYVLIAILCVTSADGKSLAGSLGLEWWSWWLPSVAIMVASRSKRESAYGCKNQSTADTPGL